MINVSICLTDIPKEKITTSEKNGKKYLNIVVDQRKEVSQYGETHTVYISQTKEQREAKEQKVYLGGGKEYKFENKEQPTQQQAVPIAPAQKEEDLPFN
jgi:CO dehydrogenase/acetyl-CoA synthase delta subunit